MSEQPTLDPKWVRKRELAEQRWRNSKTKDFLLEAAIDGSPFMEISVALSERFTRQEAIDLIENLRYFYHLENMVTPVEVPEFFQ